jgi:hypothetical protein
MHVASHNTAAATELCIRSARRLAGAPFALTVGDGGSTDGSLKMLRKFATRGVIDLEVVPAGRSHAQWLDQWHDECPERYCVFSDSDVEYLGAGWLAAMLETAEREQAALVATRIQARDGVEYRHPTTGLHRILARRPEPWLVLIDVVQTRGRVTTGFRYFDRQLEGGPTVAYDVAAGFFEDLDRQGLRWVEMPPSFASAYHHFGGLSWQSAFGRGVPARRRVKQLAKRMQVWARLQRARLIDFRARPAATVPRA